VFKIGEFSRLSLVSAKTLRYYDELGLLKPVQVDEFTGYRYYAASQLPRLNRILVLKDLGLSLQQIAELLDQNLTPEQIRGILRLKQVELRKFLEEGQARLARIEGWLQAFEQEAMMPAYDIVLKKLPAMRAAEAREVIAGWEQLTPALERLYPLVDSYIRRAGASRVGHRIVIFYESEQEISIGVCMPFEGELVEGSQVKVVELPAVETMASLIHHGSFSGLRQAYTAISTWIETNGYRMSGPSREIYLECEPDMDPSHYVTEIQFPVEKRGP